MNAAPGNQEILSTSVGDFPLDEYRLKTPNGEISILHVAAMLTHDDEAHFLLELENPLPYGIALWAATVALAHDIVSRAADFQGKTVLELGAGTGLPGIAAATLGARVVQTDRNSLAMSLCKRNAARNRIETIEHRVADWLAWNVSEKFDFLIGSDILYGAETQTALRGIFETNLAAGGRILLSDPFRATSLRLMEEMEKDGWTIAIAKWNVGAKAANRPIGVFELAPPD